MLATLTLLMAFGLTVSYGAYVHLQTQVDAREGAGTISALTPTPDRSSDDNAASLEDADVITADIIEDLRTSLEATSLIYADLADPAGDPDAP
jgi:hypothetical protein